MWIRQQWQLHSFYISRQKILLDWPPSTNNSYHSYRICTPSSHEISSKLRRQLTPKPCTPPEFYTYRHNLLSRWHLLAYLVDQNQAYLWKFRCRLCFALVSANLDCRNSDNSSQIWSSLLHSRWSCPCTDSIRLSRVHRPLRKFRENSEKFGGKFTENGGCTRGKNVVVAL